MTGTIQSFSSAPSASSRLLRAALILVAVVLFTFFQRQGAVGVRGSDQYWYVQDAARIASGKSHTTNAVFPNSEVFFKEDGGLRTPFVHNTLPVYLASLFVPMTDPYRAWLIANWLGAILIGAAGAVTAWRLTGSADISIAAFCLYLCFPMTVWEASQPLSEILTGVPIALALVCLSRPERFVNWVAATILIGMAFMSRESYLVATLLIPAVYPVVFGIRKRTLELTAVLFLIALSFIPVAHTFFPANTAFCPPLLRLLANTPYADSMVCFYDKTPSSYPVAEVARKIIGNITQQFVLTSKFQWVFYLPFWLLVAAGMTLRRDSRLAIRAVLLFSLTLLITHAAEIVIYQDQFRYKQPIFVVVLVCGLTALNKIAGLQPSYWRFGTASLLTGVMMVLLVFEKSALGESADQIRRFNALRNYLAILPTNEGVVIGRPVTGRPIPGIPATFPLFHAVPLAAEPRTVLHLDAIRLSSEDCELMAKSKVRWMLASPGERLFDVVRHNDVPLSPPVEDEAQLGAIRLWSVDLPGGTCPLKGFESK